MSNFQDFNTTLEKFQEEINNLEVIAGAYKKLEQLKKDYETVKNNLEASNSIINKSSKLLEEKLVIIERNIKSEIENISEKEIIFQKEIETSFNKQYKRLEDGFDDIKSSNKKFYSEFENTVKIKLEDNKLEIKKIIDSCEQKIKVINDLIIKYEKQIKTNKILIIAFGCVIVLLLIRHRPVFCVNENYSIIKFLYLQSVCKYKNKLVHD